MAGRVRRAASLNGTAEVEKEITRAFQQAGEDLGDLVNDRERHLYLMECKKLAETDELVAKGAISEHRASALRASIIASVDDQIAAVTNLTKQVLATLTARVEMALKPFDMGH